MIKCSKCKKNIKNDNVLICPYCGNFIKAPSLFGVIGGIFLILFIINNIFTSNISENKSEEVQKLKKTKSKIEKLDDEYHFMLLCEKVVKNQLKHPSSFKSSWLNSSTSYVGDNKAIVNLAYTAKNSFNLKLKYRAICTFNDKTTLIDFQNYERND